MNVDERVVAVVRGWVQKAENDLSTAAHTLKLAGDCPTDTVCFHAQQCAEKYIKALLALRQTPFPKSNSVSALLRLLPAGARPTVSEAEQARLTDYAVVARYPGEYEPISLAEARRAVGLWRKHSAVEAQSTHGVVRLTERPEPTGARVRTPRARCLAILVANPRLPGPTAACDAG